MQISEQFLELQDRSLEGSGGTQATVAGGQDPQDLEVGTVKLGKGVT